MRYFDNDKNEITEAEYNIRISASKRFGTWKLVEIIDGKTIRHPALKQYSDEQNTARDIEEANAPVPPSPEKYSWLKSMKRSDKNMMPRHMEDLITDNRSLTIHANMKARYDEKVALRATKP